MGILMKKSSQNADGTTISGIYIRKEFSQLNILNKYSGPPMANFFGYCLAATGQWLDNPEEVENNITKIKFDTKTMNMQMEYKASILSTPDYLLKNFRTLKTVNCSDSIDLTPEALYNKIIYSNDGKILKNCRIMIGLTDDSNLGHALGVIINKGQYYLFDANEGICSFTDKSCFWHFIYNYLKVENGLLAQGYKKFYIAAYNSET